MRLKSKTKLTTNTDEKIKSLFLYWVLYRNYYEKHLKEHGHVHVRACINFDPNQVEIAKIIFEAIIGNIAYDILKRSLMDFYKSKKLNFDPLLIKRLYKYSKDIIYGKQSSPAIKQHIHGEMSANAYSKSAKITSKGVEFNPKKFKAEIRVSLSITLNKKDFKIIKKRAVERYNNRPNNTKVL